jgi:hypothetical protein
MLKYAELCERVRLGGDCQPYTLRLPYAAVQAQNNLTGEVAEWLKALASKASLRRPRNVGSNPTLSAVKPDMVTCYNENSPTH